MSLINPAILYGAALATIPVILHFLLRSKPKKLVFPALRLIQVRRRQNVQRLRLRHLLLLLLRIVVILLFVLALARPSLPSADYALNTRELVTAVAIVVLAGMAYWGILTRWKRRRLPHHTLAYRRTFLRGVVGVLAAGLLGLFVVWPYQKRVFAEMAAPLPDVAERFPVAAVFLFDTSLSMEYRLENKTRLEVAQAVAIEHLNRLPNRSRIAVTDTSNDDPILYQADLGSAQSRIESLKPSHFSVPLNGRLRTALGLQKEDRRRMLESGQSAAASPHGDGYLREIYVLTDLARSAWVSENSGRLRDALEQHPWVSLYLIDVGVTAPINAGLHSLRLSDESLPRGGRLFVETSVSAVGLPNVDRTVELYVQKAGSAPVKQGQQTVTLSGESDVRLQFTVDGLNGPLHRGQLRINGSDPFAADDVQHFTVQVRPPIEVLLVGPSREQTDYLSMALAPTELVRLGKARYRCTYAEPGELATRDLGTYDAVALISVAALSESAWRALGTYADGGGGLAVFLGTHGVPTAVSYNSPAAQAVLPAELVASLKFVPPEFLDPADLSHPIFQKFADLGGASELAAQGVHRYWKVTPHEDAHTVIRYTDRAATSAIVERLRGRGRVVVLTTSIDLKGWSEIPHARWQFVAFGDQLMQYLVRSTERRLNYVVGEDVFVPIDPSLGASRFFLRKPGLQQVTHDVPEQATLLILHDVDQVGQYDVVSAVPNVEFATGFSANSPPGESDFQRLAETDLDGMFGENRYGLAQDIEGLTRRVTTGRLGEEVFPLLLALVLIVFCAEHFVANWFYEEIGEDETPSK